ncbi:MAG: alpha/beta fold hydrolase [Bacteroidota bacterium]
MPDARVLLSLSLCLGLAACASAPASPDLPPTLTAQTADGVTIYGETYMGDLDASAPLVLLFHQAGANGRSEYAEIAAWLNASGIRAIAWDQRAGGDHFGGTNRTADGLVEGTPAEFCDAYPDLVAALEATSVAVRDAPVFVWGSSYSAALVFQLVAKHPERVAGVLAFSPASGGPMAACRARQWLDDVEAPALVLRPASEMERESSIEQRDLMEAAGVEVHVVENGVHGSSMLVDSRTEHDMASARSHVLAWIQRQAR